MHYVVLQENKDTTTLNGAEIVEPEHVDKGICRDPDDLMNLRLVYPGNADVIVTGDKDLLVIKDRLTNRSH